MDLDDWQKEILQTTGNICLRSGRQVGKSTIISIKAAEYAIANIHKTILIIASVERQASLLFDKTLGYIHDNYKTYIKTGKDKPTKHVIKLKNGSTIYCLPTGLSGYGIRGYSVDLLIADEAAFIPEDVWTAVTPMLAARANSSIWLLSTPFGREGYFYRCFSDPQYKSFHISSETIPRISKDFLAAEKRRMTKLQYTQEYLGEFIDELRQLFPTELIKKVAILSKTSLSPIGDTFLGVDVARLGADESVLASVELILKKRVKMLDLEITTKTRITETAGLIVNAHARWNFKRVYVDDGGVGGGVFDVLLKDSPVKRKIVALNNSQKSLDYHDEKRKKLQKESMYMNLLWLMENGWIELFDDENLILSLRSIQYEYNDKGQMLITGNYSHIAEALVRACWCIKDKDLPLSVWAA